MSLLDEALERQLKKMFPQVQKPAATKAAPVKAPVTGKGVVTGQAKNVTNRWHLVYDEGTSDKEYIVEVVLTANDYDVIFEYGRRGRTRQKGCKEAGLLLRDAMLLARRIVAEKIAKGYREI